ncbi:MAG TPA: DUF2642 domain-containing protein [Actinomycetota bacterium]|nr:DUF2642 domain-containing protein [Actinomycetota bacterium]
MGGPQSVGWAEALEASFEAGLAREDEVAAADLAFSLRQDLDLRDAVVRSDAAWDLLGPDAAVVAVVEAGVDYVRAGALIVPASRAVLRSKPGVPPRATTSTLLQLLGRACRAGAEVAVETSRGTTSGALVRVGKDHVAVRNGDAETVVGLAGIEAVRLLPYSASRGFSG